MRHQEDVGARIKMFRKLRHITQAELAEKIHKSKSILSKYELGQANVDIETLFSIAEALEITAADLLDVVPSAEACPKTERYGIFQNEKLYILMKTIAGVWKGVLCLANQEDGSVQACLYMQVADYQQPLKCRAIYKGLLYSYPTNAVVVLHNVVDDSDMITISVGLYKGTQTICGGLIIQFSYLTNSPAATRMILSSIPQMREDAAEQILLLDKKDVNSLRKSNLLLAPEYIAEPDLFQV